ncbi:MAG: hypothetical protein PWQ67_2590 [Clostridia bacterium]|nr:hypothetical protein [Clostridia bacterium]
MKQTRKPIRLNITKLNELQKKKGLNDTQLAEKIGVSPSTLWRVKLPINDSRYNSPGEDFIAGVLKAFPEICFEDIFFLDKVSR